MSSSFAQYYTARTLEALQDSDQFLPVFSASDIQIYPFQMGAVQVALSAQHLGGVILCDEAGLGKSHEALMIVAQRWYAGQHRILLCVPNKDLLKQWVAVLEQHYTIPYVVADGNMDVFDQDGIVLATYDFVVKHASLAKEIPWDVAIFDEATALSSVYQEDCKQGRVLKEVVGHGFKVLLTGTPIEKNIMDLYGLLYFIDHTKLPDVQDYLKRYLRKPENYPELAQFSSQYCYRTLRTQATQYAKIPNRVPLTCQYTPSAQERAFSEGLFAYCQKPDKIAFPEMKVYDLSLRLMSLQSSSTAAILQTLEKIHRRVNGTPEGEEIAALITMGQAISQDSKVTLLMQSIKQGFSKLKKIGALEKVLIFTESVATQAMLFEVLKHHYSVALYNGTANYTAIEQFQKDAQILISTDNGARGFHLAQASFVIHYDLPFNTLKLEQRIDRCHRLGQDHDVISLAFIDPNNFADVRKLELASKRTLVSHGVFGMTDSLLGGFTQELLPAIKALPMRTASEIDQDYKQTLEAYEDINCEQVRKAEDVLFTTFTKELAQRIKINPQYVKDRSVEIENQLWELAKGFFNHYNQTHTGCQYVIEETTRTITAENCETLPLLFYYWNGSRNQKYYSQKAYGMDKSFKPRNGRITLTSILGRGLLHEIQCYDKGTIHVSKPVEPCQIALYDVEQRCNGTQVSRFPLLVGLTAGNGTLNHQECEKLLQLPYSAITEDGRATANWLRTSAPFHKLDSFAKEMASEKKSSQTDEAQKQAISEILQLATQKKTALSQEVRAGQGELDKLTAQLSKVSGNRMQTIQLERKRNQLQQSVKRQQEQLFFQEMEIDVEAQKQIDQIIEKDKLDIKMVRQFVVELEEKRNDE